MKRTLLSTILSLIALTTPNLSYASDLNNGLLYWWDFESSSQPVDGNGGTLPEWSDPFGWEAGDGFGTINNTGSAPTSPTLSGIKANSFTISLDVRNAVSNGLMSSLFQIKYDDALNDLSLNHYPLIDLDGLTLFPPSLDEETVIPDAFTSISGDAFTTITLTSTGNSIKVYVNGIFGGEQLVSGDWSSALVTNINFGQYDGAQKWTSAEIDNIGIWDRVLTEQEIENLAQIPEPSSSALALLGSCVFLLRRRRPTAAKA